MSTKNFARLGQGLVAVAAIVLGAQMAGCVEPDVTAEQPTAPVAAERAAKAEVADEATSLHDKLVGTWQFVYTPERRADVEKMLAEKTSDPAELEKAKRASEEEAAASEVEFTADREYISRIGSEVIMSAKYEAKPDGASTLVLNPLGSDMKIRIDVDDAHDTITMHDPKKGALQFTRK